ncbi:hypothetical protein Scep_018150 [Stephania cephalantha]|uniref:F-box domain-containing protein n=1 Tax=Stephania cephalantha TaxID=152367 RepID=A0AAP0IQW7_9MAGN
MPGFLSGKKQFEESEMYFSTAVERESLSSQKVNYNLNRQEDNEFYTPILPGLPDDVAKYCLALVPRFKFPVMGTVSKRWRSYIQSKEFITVRKLAGRLEEWLYILTGDSKGKGNHWEILGCLDHANQLLPPMPGPTKAGFSVVVLDGNLLVMAGYSIYEGTDRVSSEVYQYDSRLNSWSTLANMNVARYDFASAEVNGMVYAVGGYGHDGESLSSAEVYDPNKNKWTLIESLRRPRRAALVVDLKVSSTSWEEGLVSQLETQNLSMSTTPSATHGMK